MDSWRPVLKEWDVASLYCNQRYTCSNTLWLICMQHTKKMLWDSIVWPPAANHLKTSSADHHVLQGVWLRKHRYCIESWTDIFNLHMRTSLGCDIWFALVGDMWYIFINHETCSRTSICLNSSPMFTLWIEAEDHWGRMGHHQCAGKWLRRHPGKSWNWWKMETSGLSPKHRVFFEHVIFIGFCWWRYIYIIFICLSMSHMFALGLQ